MLGHPETIVDTCLDGMPASAILLAPMHGSSACPAEAVLGRPHRHIQAITWAPSSLGSGPGQGCQPTHPGIPERQDHCVRLHRARCPQPRRCDKQITWRDVAIGAIATALLFTIGKSLIGLYIGSSHIASGYGAAGSLIVLLVWIY